jgi:MinD-like ATPase involved in chromosome partitioning or flagellar assembly
MVPAKHQLLRLTVVSPFGQHEIDLPADAPVSGFLPDLLAMAGLQLSQARLAADGWHLTDQAGRPIPAYGTLAAHGVQAGALIELRRSAADQAGGPVQVPGPDDTGGGEPRAGVGVLRDKGAVSRHLPRTVVHSVSPDDDLSPLERAEALLPHRISRSSRLRAVGRAFALGSDTGEDAATAGRGTEAQPASAPPTPPRPLMQGYRQPQPPSPSLEQAPASGPGLDGYTVNGSAHREPDSSGEHHFPAQKDLVSRPSGKHRYRPADLTIESAPSRLERARVKWRELDNLGQLDARITEPRLMHCATIAVVSPKGGVGKTTVTALLGTLFSLLRRDPIVAVDTNPDFGSLGRVLTPDQNWFVDDLARLVLEDDELSLTSLDSLLGRAVHGLLVVPSPTDPDRMTALDEEAYRRVITRLKDFFSLVLLDCGTGLQDPALSAAIAAADQVVLLTDAQPATASLVAESTELLHQWGRPITVVVNRMPLKGAKLDVGRLSRYLPAARGLVVVPDDVVAATRLATGRFNWRDAPESWQFALRRLATVLVADWERLGLAR